MLEAYLSNVGRDKNTQTQEEFYKASIKMTKKQAEDAGLPQVSLTIKDPDEKRLQDLLNAGEVTIKIITN